MRNRPTDPSEVMDQATEHDTPQGIAGNVQSRSTSADHMQPPPAHVAAQELPVFKRCARRSGMSPEGFAQALTQSSLARLTLWTLADLETLLLASERLGLSPLGRELYLLRDNDDIHSPAVVVLGVDGWCRVINTHKRFAGVQFRESKELVDGVPTWMECTLHRWDRRVPTSVREYFSEVRRLNEPWFTHPRRMLRHKALVQCARVAFGLVGVYDHDEAQRLFKAQAEVNQDNVSMCSHSFKHYKKITKGDLGVSAVLAELAKRQNKGA